jgi:hypothetical protein
MLGFDSRQLHSEVAGQSHELWPVFFFINISSTSGGYAADMADMADMASLRSGKRRDGSGYVQVLYRLNGKQSSTSFEDLPSATKFQKQVDKFGAAKALARRSA